MVSDFSKITNIKNVGVVGLGLIGGSFAKAFSVNSDSTVYGYDLNSTVVDAAVNDGTLKAPLTDSVLSELDLLIIALYPQATINYLREKAPLLKKTAIVVDTCGIKRNVCEECQAIAHKYGFTFVGGHPMAGKKFSGYEYSTDTLFNNASMVIVPEKEDKDFIEFIRAVFSPCEFGMITVCDPAKHDQMIAFTSQMAHLVSNAYIKSPTAKEHAGFSAGSYKDMTRVAWLNETMWTELFLLNKDNLINELDYIINFLQEYKDALTASDAEKLWQLLHDGKVCKEEVDGI